MKQKIINILCPLFRFIIRVFWVFPIKRHKILLWNFGGEAPGDSPLYLEEFIKTQKTDYKIYWIVKNHEQCIERKKEEEVYYIKKYSISYFYHIATSSVWILNTRSDPYFVKRKKQLYIQTWHSALRLKKIEADAEEYLDPSYIKNAKRDAAMTDIMTCGNGFSENTYRNSFYFDGKIAKIGTPRVDVLLSAISRDEAKDIVLTALDICNNKKIILYTPTFRRGIKSELWVLNLSWLQKKLGEKYVILARAHPRTTIPIPKGVIDVTAYPDIQQLIMACDVLITDYSGCCFDAMYASKKCVLYTPDRKEYEMTERATYFKTSDLPFSECVTKEALIDEIKKSKDADYEARIKDFLLRINNYERGDASKKLFSIVQRYEKI